MNKTTNQGYNLVENTDTISNSIQAWNGNFNKIDGVITALEDNFDVATSSNSNDFITTDSASGYNKGNIKIGDGPELRQVTTTGKNLFDSDLKNKSGNTYVTFSNGKITFLPIGSESSEYIIFKTDAYTKDVQYTFSFTAKSSEANAIITFDGQPDNATGAGYFNDETYTLSTNPTRYSKTGTITSDFTGLRFFRTQGTTGSLTSTIEITDIQLELGSTATDYEPYTGGQASPSPDYPQDIVVVEENSVINGNSKNVFKPLLKIDDTNIVTSHCTVTLDNDTFNLHATQSDIYFGEIVATGQSWQANRGYLIEVMPNTNYTVYFTNTSIVKNFVTYYDANKVSLGYQSYNYSTFSVATPENAKYMSLRFGIGASAVAGNNYSTKVQVEKGSIATTYTPYRGNKSFPITLPTGMFLGKIGTASNYIYGTKDNWKLHSGLIKFVFDGTEEWNLKFPSTDNWFYWYYSNTPLVDSTENAGIYSNYALPTIVGNTNTNQGIYINGSYIRIREGTEDTIANWEAKLAQKNMIVYAKLATPTDTNITDATLVSQLNNIADNLQTYKGGTVVFTTSDNLEPNIQFDYLVNPLASIEARLALLED